MFWSNWNKPKNYYSYSTKYHLTVWELPPCSICTVAASEKYEIFFVRKKSNLRFLPERHLFNVANSTFELETRIPDIVLNGSLLDGLLAKRPNHGIT